MGWSARNEADRGAEIVEPPRGDRSKSAALAGIFRHRAARTTSSRPRKGSRGNERVSSAFHRDGAPMELGRAARVGGSDAAGGGGGIAGSSDGACVEPAERFCPVLLAQVEVAATPIRLASEVRDLSGAVQPERDSPQHVPIYKARPRSLLAQSPPERRVSWGGVGRVCGGVE
jgi:hypothetical protein